MKPGQVIELPRADKRYKIGAIKLDKKGRLRGHPETVNVRFLKIPVDAPMSMQLNPPIIISAVLARSIKEGI